jgi:hypothetical protein
MIRTLPVVFVGLCFSGFATLNRLQAQDVPFYSAMGESPDSQTIICSHNPPTFASGKSDPPIVGTASEGVRHDEASLVFNWTVIGFLSATFSIGLAIVVGTLCQHERRSGPTRPLFPGRQSESAPRASDKSN